MSRIADTILPKGNTYKKNIRVFILLWILTFGIYLPAIKAGWVIDASGWLYNIRHLKFSDYINNTQSWISSLYQFTQFTTYLFYKLFDANAYAWHTLMVTLHAINAFLIYMLFVRLFEDSGVERGKIIALCGVVLYTVCPHISEVIVWEASFHYLQGFLLILLILLWVQRYHKEQKKGYVWSAGIVYLCSTYSLEIFYLTPWFVLTLALYYRYVLNYDKTIFKKVLFYFFVPQLLMFGLHLAVLAVVYGHFAHIMENVYQPFSNYICKPPRYIFHILFLGRYFPHAIRKQVYEVIGSNGGLIVFYNILVLVCCSIVSNFGKMSAKGKAGILLFVWIMICIVILMPLAFPDILLAFYDRYTYFVDAFVYMLLALLLSYLSKVLYYGILGLYAATNLYFTVKVNLLWKHSAYINNRLLKDLPDAGDKIIVLLNIPENMQGIPMIGAQPDGEYKRMRGLFVGNNPANKIYDAQSYNMINYGDGAHVMAANDSVVRVTLNQWSTWWWYEGHGGHSYETPDYKLELRDPGHWYDIILKHPPERYMLLYQQGEQWKQVNFKKKNEEQY